MSRLGKIPVEIPAGVQVKVDGQTVEVKGSKGTLTRTIHPEIKVEVKDGKVHFTPVVDREDTKALWGLNRVLVANMIHGVSQGYRRELEIVGVGYKAELKSARELSLFLGFSHQVSYKLPEGVAVSYEAKANRLTITGIDRQKVGQVAAEIRALRPPDPYKGKGVKYSDEVLKLKAGKSGA